MFWQFSIKWKVLAFSRINELTTYMQWGENNNIASQDLPHLYVYLYIHFPICVLHIFITQPARRDLAETCICMKPECICLHSQECT